MNLIAAFVFGIIVITVIYYLLMGLIFLFVMLEQLIKKLGGRNV